MSVDSKQKHNNDNDDNDDDVLVVFVDSVKKFYTPIHRYRINWLIFIIIVYDHTYQQRIIDIPLSIYIIMIMCLRFSIDLCIWIQIGLKLTICLFKMEHTIFERIWFFLLLSFENLYGGIYCLFFHLKKM